MLAAAATTTLAELSLELGLRCHLARARGLLHQVSVPKCPKMSQSARRARPRARPPLIATRRC
eukprot:6404454-Pyramimonas_sp.AAC.1